MLLIGHGREDADASPLLKIGHIIYKHLVIP